LPVSPRAQSRYHRVSGPSKRLFFGEDLMSELTRRSLLGGAAAAGAALSLGAPAHAVAPAAGKQAPAFYRYKVGDYECTSLADGANVFPIPDTFVRNISKDEAIKAAEAAYMPKGMLVVPFNPQVVNTGSKLALFDTGFGPGGANPRVGQLVANMAAAGIDPKAVDIVVLSHLHPDHANGIKDASGALVFPNAEIKLPAKDWAFWMSDENAGKAANDMMKNYFANVRKVFTGLENKVTKYEWGQEVAPGVTALDTNGHTPGHTSFAVASGASKVLIQSDVTNIPDFFLRHPDWHVAFDIDPVQAVATRKKFYDMAAAEKALVVGFHFPFPSMGYVEKDGAGYRLVPVAWNPVI
jgi:glyoxylase-like metal-dependent hydrolase (beta-lactamase superfamily II)